MADQRSDAVEAANTEDTNSFRQVESGSVLSAIEYRERKTLFGGKVTEVSPEEARRVAEALRDGQLEADRATHESVVLALREGFDAKLREAQEQKAALEAQLREQNIANKRALEQAEERNVEEQQQLSEKFAREKEALEAARKAEQEAHVRELAEQQEHHSRAIKEERRQNLAFDTQVLELQQTISSLQNELRENKGTEKVRDLQAQLGTKEDKRAFVVSRVKDALQGELHGSTEQEVNAALEGLFADLSAQKIGGKLSLSLSERAEVISNAILQSKETGTDKPVHEIIASNRAAIVDAATKALQASTVIQPDAVEPASLAAREREEHLAL